MLVVGRTNREDMGQSKPRGRCGVWQAVWQWFPGCVGCVEGRKGMCEVKNG